MYVLQEDIISISKLFAVRDMSVYNPPKLKKLSKQRVVYLQKSNALHVYIFWNFPSQLVKAEVPINYEEKNNQIESLRCMKTTEKLSKTIVIVANINSGN